MLLLIWLLLDQAFINRVGEGTEHLSDVGGVRDHAAISLV